jgi:hypothetical protein
MTGATAAGLLLITSCSSSQPSYDDLRKIALAVPVPPGLTYLREVDHVNSPAGMFGSDQKEVDVIYSNSAPTCDQLSANWLKTLQNAHRHIDSGAGSGDVYEEERCANRRRDHRDRRHVSMHGATSCGRENAIGKDRASRRHRKGPTCPSGE